MPHNNEVPIDITKATQPGRKITFDHWENDRHWYTTQFGERFWIHFHRLPATGIARQEEAADWAEEMSHFNQYHANGVLPS